MPFLDSLDVANRALQHLGARQIASITEDSVNNQEMSFVYDKVRRAELQRNNWKFAIRSAILRPLDSTTLLLNPQAYNSTTVYLPGAVVQDANGQYWISLKPDNTNQTPGGNNEYWDQYFGPLSVMPWDTSGSTAYSTGELVYMAGAVTGSYQVYMSKVNANSDTPNVANAWSVTTTYYADQVVSNAGSQWRSLLPLNLGLTPTAGGPGVWVSTITYVIGNQVTGTDGQMYTSAVNSNLGLDPTLDDGTHWTASGTYFGWAQMPASAPVSATSWLPLGSTALRALPLLYPVGAGPLSDDTSLNVFRLPAGYLKRAPQDPKRGRNSFLGIPGNREADDWRFENDFLISSYGNAIRLRFICDIAIVRKFSDMFSEGLACRMATETCEKITQSTAKVQTIASAYNRFMGEARLNNALEIGVDEPPLDDYIACRI